MPIYLLEIPGSEFTGFKGGVDFYWGKGSTSSKADADRLVVKAGCRIVEPASETKVEGVPAGIPLAISTPAGETPQETKPRMGTRKGGRKK
jgi:hypothetical protein